MLIIIVSQSNTFARGRWDRTRPPSRIDWEREKGLGVAPPNRQVVVPTSKLTIATATVVCCLLLAGCTGGWAILEGGNESAPDAAELEANAQSVDGYHLEVTRTLQSEWVNETTTVDGVVAVDDRQAHLAMTTETNVGTDPRITELEQYVDDGVQYTDDGEGWEHSGDGHWEDTDQLGTAAGTLENASFEPIRNEPIDGVETTMFEVNVSDDVESDLVGVEGSQHVETSVEQFVYYVFVDTETNTLYGTDLRMEVSQGGEPALVTIQTTFTEQDEAGGVTAPEDLPETSDTDG